MTLDRRQQDLLLRYLDDNVTSGEFSEVESLLSQSSEAREFLRDISEQAIATFDTERIREEKSFEPGRQHRSDRDRGGHLNKSRVWAWSLTTAAMIALMSVVSFQVFATSAIKILRVSKVTGSTEYFGAAGEMREALHPGAELVAGDTLRTRSCDGWIELELRDGSTMTIAGHSTLRILSAQKRENRFKLLEGNLWFEPTTTSLGTQVAIQTTTGNVEARDAQFDIQTSDTEMIVRVNRGTAHLTRNVDGLTEELPEGEQLVVALGDRAPLTVKRQPEPAIRWSCNFSKVPESILGRWLPPDGEQQVRLRAVPLAWPVGDRSTIMLYAVALAAWRDSERPVLLHDDSRLVFQGRTSSPRTVRFGFSTQKMRGVFSGKFELDVVPAMLAPAGEVWKIELPLKDFRPLHPHLASTPDDLELTDVYALTLHEDVGLEIYSIDLHPGEKSP